MSIYNVTGYLLIFLHVLVGGLLSPLAGVLQPVR